MSEKISGSQLRILSHLKLSSWSIVFLCWLVSEAIIVLALIGYVFGQLQSLISESDSTTEKSQQASSYNRSTLTYLALFVFGQLYRVGWSIEALSKNNIIETICICIVSVALIIYSGLNVDQIHRSLEYSGDSADYWHILGACAITVPIVIFVGFLILSYAAWKLYYEFGWSIYKHMGADISSKRRFLWYEIFVSLIMLDFFYFLGFTLQFLVIVLKTDDVEFVLTIVVIPVTIAILVLARWAVRKEYKPAMYIALAFLLAGLPYFLFKLVRMYEPAQQDKYLAARKSMTTFAVLTIIFLIATIANGIICLANFGKGLKDQLAHLQSTSTYSDDLLQDDDSVFQHTHYSSYDIKKTSLVLTHQHNSFYGGGRRMSLE